MKYLLTISLILLAGCAKTIRTTQTPNLIAPGPEMPLKPRIVTNQVCNFMGCEFVIETVPVCGVEVTLGYEQAIINNKFYPNGIVTLSGCAFQIDNFVVFSSNPNETW